MSVGWVRVFVYKFWRPVPADGERERCGGVLNIFAVPHEFRAVTFMYIHMYYRFILEGGIC